MKREARFTYSSDTHRLLVGLYGGLLMGLLSTWRGIPSWFRVVAWALCILAGVITLLVEFIVRFVAHEVVDTDEEEP